MKTIEVKKFPYGNGYQYRVRTGYSVVAGQTWRNAITIADIRNQYPDVPFEFFQADERTRYTPLNVKYNRRGMITAMEDFNPSKVKGFTIDEFWPEDEQLNFIRNEMTELPDDIDTPEKALHYAKVWSNNMALENYDIEAIEKIKAGLTERMGPDIEFLIE